MMPKQNCLKPVSARVRIYISRHILCWLLLVGSMAYHLLPHVAFGQGSMDIGGNRPIQMARATWDTGWFQAEVYRQLLMEMGYQVERPRTFDNADFYQAAADGDVDFWVNGWFPLHDLFLTGAIEQRVEIVGTQVQGGALQGYLIDKQSADALEIRSLTDFRRPEVAAHFDRDRDGLADLVGCNSGWACALIVEHHLVHYDLQGTVEQIQGDYGPLMLNELEQIAAGKPSLFFGFTPSWTIGELVPGQDIIWLGVPSPSLPEGQAGAEQLTVVPNVAGCVADPCPMGFPPNDIRTVANREFLSVNPAIRALLQQVVIPLEDISAQNALLLAGEEEQRDIERHAANWIDTNRARVDRWLFTAADAHDETLVTDAARENAPKHTTEASPIRVVTKPLAPFVLYNVDTHEYTGFSIQLWQLIAQEANLTYELYGVNTLAKLLDEVERGAADVATAGIGITAHREGTLDFSYAYFESGLQIMVATEERGLWGNGILKFIDAIFSPQLLNVLGFLLICLLIAAHIMWLSERHINEDFAESYWPGIWEAFWWSAVTATTVGYGDKTPKTIPGRIIGLLWMFSGLFVLASFTASIATTFAIEEVNSHIAGPIDLPGKRVATIERSTAEDYLKRQSIRPILFSHEEDAYAALLNNEVDAIVYDAPVLQHFVSQVGDGRVTLAGNIFQEQQYGVAVSQNTALREQINLALLRLIESGEYAVLYGEWFGDE